MDLTLENIVFLKPKKYSEYLVSKVRYSDEDFVIQFPKMIISDISEKSMELEFTNNFFFCIVFGIFCSSSCLIDLYFSIIIESITSLKFLEIKICGNNKLFIYIILYIFNACD